jgi:benzoate/toluate 1,2-dioxygenase reductase subunit
MVFHAGRIVAKRLASPTVTILELDVPTLASFHPGQWVDFVAPPHDWVGGFSLASSPSELPNVTLTVKASSQTPAQWVTKGSSVGDNVRIRVGGSCVLYKDFTKPAVFCAGGIGISPLFCMYRQHVQERGAHHGKGAYFLYLAAKEEELVLVEELMELASSNADRLFVSLTRQNEWNKPLEGVECVTGREAMQTFLSDDTPSDAIYYLCGPPSMLDEALYMLQRKGISSERIVHEKWW